jgi:hypothetical protein
MLACCLTFDMSGGPKGAQRPLGRPLDGGVRPRGATYERNSQRAPPYLQRVEIQRIQASGSQRHCDDDWLTP